MGSTSKKSSGSFTSRRDLPVRALHTLPYAQIKKTDQYTLKSQILRFSPVQISRNVVKKKNQQHVQTEYHVSLCARSFEIAWFLKNIKHLLGHHLTCCKNKQIRNFHEGTTYRM